MLNNYLYDFLSHVLCKDSANREKHKAKLAFSNYSPLKNNGMKFVAHKCSSKAIRIQETDKDSDAGLLLNIFHLRDASRHVLPSLITACFCPPNHRITPSVFITLIQTKVSRCGVRTFPSNAS